MGFGKVYRLHYFRFIYMSSKIIFVKYSILYLMGRSTQLHKLFKTGTFSIYFKVFIVTLTCYSPLCIPFCLKFYSVPLIASISIYSLSVISWYIVVFSIIAIFTVLGFTIYTSCYQINPMEIKVISIIPPCIISKKIIAILSSLNLAPLHPAKIALGIIYYNSINIIFLPWKASSFKLE